MLQAVNSSHNTTPVSSSASPPINCKGDGRRKPLQILTGIFTRKGNRDVPPISERKDNFFLSDDGDSWDDLDDDIPEPREALHSPYHARKIDEDMQNLRLSRQDNPFLQVIASRECLNESDDGSISEFEEKNLMSKENLTSHAPLSLEEVHARLVRSPPPVMWTRSRSSEPSFGHLSSSHFSSMKSDCIFKFPPHDTPTVMTLSMPIEPSPTLSSRSQGSSFPQGHGRSLGPFKKENTLDILTGKFHLSPQPRRKPANKSYSDFSSAS